MPLGSSSHGYMAKERNIWVPSYSIHRLILIFCVQIASNSYFAGQSLFSEPFGTFWNQLSPAEGALHRLQRCSRVSHFVAEENEATGQLHDLRVPHVISLPWQPWIRKPTIGMFETEESVPTNSYQSQGTIWDLWLIK